ncbi:hypothetical protein [Aliarcobacter butzleri]|uniref:Uncharacterized protein n=1 Tax=Aliarcobacter butzleri (strain RM4018) TaxID=367737 RepID=A8ESB4_ALIB4|nr:hypothetical protein [Aliarcobacter butzleri]ABV66838.1 hypothetical protein Abu_0571 [Aliarcobacter butzleri RM4018]MCR8709430.1 hypothetical protein [Aliarcobacter butzleri]RZV15815.1 hypothetical protein D3M61_00545 [Aliarcobacter butzleri]RZV18447.1 hypothetical protein D3M75_05540 [Aliarcobacter butzleri]SNV25534.1 Uncharacterised protein [Aliarcobacter butzleri]
MKNSVLKFATVTALVLGLTTLGASELSKLDVKKECNVEANGVEKVIATAAKYNEIAVKHQVEFMRLGMKASQYIEAVNNSLKNGLKTIDIVDAKGKKTEEATIEFGAWRACSFAIGAVVQEEEAKTTWKLASPSDGYKY